jgi:hypothetical protein
VHHRRGLRSQTVGKGLVGRDDEFLADHNGRSHSIFLTREQQDHFIPCGKVLFPSFHYFRDSSSVVLYITQFHVMDKLHMKYLRTIEYLLLASV